MAFYSIFPGPEFKYNRKLNHKTFLAYVMQLCPCELVQLLFESIKPQYTDNHLVILS